MKLMISCRLRDGVTRRVAASLAQALGASMRIDGLASRQRALRCPHAEIDAGTADDPLKYVVQALHTRRAA